MAYDTGRPRRRRRSCPTGIGQQRAAEEGMFVDNKSEQESRGGKGTTHAISYGILAHLAAPSFWSFLNDRKMISMTNELDIWT